MSTVEMNSDIWNLTDFIGVWPPLWVKAALPLITIDINWSYVEFCFHSQTIGNFRISYYDFLEKERKKYSLTYSPRVKFVVCCTLVIKQPFRNKYRIHRIYMENSLDFSCSIKIYYILNVELELLVARWIFHSSGLKFFYYLVWRTWTGTRHTTFSMFDTTFSMFDIWCFQCLLNFLQILLVGWQSLFKMHGSFRHFYWKWWYRVQIFP